MKYFALLLLAFFQVALSVLLGHKRQSKVSRTFIGFTSILFLWTLANISLDYALNALAGPLSDRSMRLLILNIANRAGFVFGTLSILMLSRLISVFPVKRKDDAVSRLIIYGGAGMSALCLFPYVSGSYAMAEGSSIPVYRGGQGAGGIIAYFVIVAIFSVAVAVRAQRNTKDEAVRRQTRTILASLLVTAVIALTIIIILPTVLHADSFIFLGYFAPYIFALTMVYSIFRQGFLEFRGFVVRSLAYLLSLALLATIYGFFVFTISKVLFGFRVSVGAEIFLSMATAVVALLFGPFKTVFDKSTTKLFYRDAYDPQELYTSLNRVLVSSLDVRYLMMESLSVIETALKPDFAAVGLKSREDQQRVFSTRKLAFHQDDLALLRTLTPKIRRKVIVADELDTERQAALHEVLQRNDIAALVRLTQNVRNGEEGFGYLVLGVKKSGNPYTSQDARVLDTVANELIIAIQNALHYEEIQQFNLVLQARVDEATRKLRRNNEKLKELDDTKDDFISMASHQLRTPLTSVKGYLSMVLEGDAGKINETQRKMLGQAFISSQRMVYLIADLLNVSRLKTGKFIIESVSTDLSKMIEEELGQLTETAAGRDLTLTYDKPDGFPQLMLDETKTRQVIMNFVDNAIYYTPAGGHIRVELVDTGPMVELRVVDDGIGVPKAEQHHLFTKFYRAGNARKARPDGTGLGLFMAKKVVTAQGGAIIFDSTEGKGSTFGFTFSKAKLAATAADNQPAGKIPEQSAKSH